MSDWVLTKERGEAAVQVTGTTPFGGKTSDMEILPFMVDVRKEMHNLPVRNFHHCLKCMLECYILLEKVGICCN